MAFERTPDGEKLAAWVTSQLGCRDLNKTRQWCEWQLMYWGKRGGWEAVDIFVAYVKKRARDPAAYAFVLMAYQEFWWMKDSEYLAMKKRHFQAMQEYKTWRVEHPDTSSSEGIEESIQRLRNRWEEEGRPLTKSSRDEQLPRHVEW